MRARLTIETGEDIGEAIQLSRLGSFTIGRHRGNDLRVKDNGLSRKHCRIDYDGESYWIVDLDSHNGTHVNGHKITRTMLYDGDVIRIAHTRIVFAREPEDQDEWLER